MAMASSGREGAEATFAWMQEQYDRIYEMRLENVQNLMNFK